MSTLPRVFAEVIATLPTGRVVLFAKCPFCGVTHVHYISRYEDISSYYETASPRNADCGRGHYEIILNRTKEE